MHVLSKLPNKLPPFVKEWWWIIAVTKAVHMTRNDYSGGLKGSQVWEILIIPYMDLPFILYCCV